MKGSKIRSKGPKMAAFTYAGYKWFEDHTDDVEVWAKKAIDRSRGKSVEKYVTPPAKLVISAARWVRANGGGNASSTKIKKR
ncbi:MAG: hypothetical protein M3343_01910 [Actinomycetota bacterium]|nr:hypothetical protein [Actinomycetota bacterium]